MIFTLFFLRAFWKTAEFRHFMDDLRESDFLVQWKMKTIRRAVVHDKNSRSVYRERRDLHRKRQDHVVHGGNPVVRAKLNDVIYTANDRKMLFTV